MKIPSSEHVIAGVITMSKTDRHSLCQKVCQIISVIPENWHFNSRLVLKATKQLWRVNGMVAEAEIRRWRQFEIW